jgi:hypothetical protein
MDADPDPWGDRRMDDMLDVTCRLIEEFSATAPAGVVIEHVAAARETLTAHGVAADLAPATEVLARFRLSPFHARAVA